MIQANELRIGNLVGTNYDKFPYKVFELRKAVAELDSVEADSHVHGISFDSLRPIPLTEEWILMAGFFNTQIGLFEMEVLGYGKINIHITKKRLLVELGTKGGYLFGNTKIEFIHQLQNLFYILTGQELTLQASKI